MRETNHALAILPSSNALRIPGIQATCQVRTRINREPPGTVEARSHGRLKRMPMEAKATGPFLRKAESEAIVGARATLPAADQPLRPAADLPRKTAQAPTPTRTPPDRKPQQYTRAALDYTTATPHPLREATSFTYLPSLHPPRHPPPGPPSLSSIPSFQSSPSSPPRPRHLVFFPHRCRRGERRAPLPDLGFPRRASFEER
jgi:hypothetical protein